SELDCQSQNSTRNEKDEHKDRRYQNKTHHCCSHLVSLPTTWGGIKGGVAPARHPLPIPSPRSGEGHLFLRTPRCSLLSVTSPHSGLDISPHVEIAFDLQAERIASVHKIFEDHVDDVLVKHFHVAK